MPGLAESGNLGEEKMSHTASAYTHRPPTIVPNYGRKKKGLLPKSNISRVLLYDNVMQQQMLEVKLNNLKVEKRRTGRLFDLHRKSFMLRQSHKKHMLEKLTIVSEKKSVLPVIGKANSQTSSSGPGSPVRKRHRSLPTIHPDAASESVNRVTVDLKDVFDEIENVEKANEISLPDIERNSSLIDVRKAHGITTSFLIQTVEIPTEVPEARDEQQPSDVVVVRPSVEGINVNQLDIREQGEPGISDPVRQTKVSPIVGEKRFQSLQRALHRMDLPTEGFAELSPSFTRTYAKIPDYLTLI